MSPTNSGKSYMMYCIARYLLGNPSMKCKSGIIIVPNVQLVEQLSKDFKDYSSVNRWNTDKCVQKIYEGRSKKIIKPLIISTWQSIYDIEDNDFFSQFDFVIGDEAHAFQAKSLSSVMTKLVNAKYRIGTTGTLDDGVEVHYLTIEGHFGPATKLTTNKKMIDAGYSAPLDIKSIVLRHKEKISKDVFKEISTDERNNYQKEIDYLVECEVR